MDWKSIAPLIASAAPIAGKILGGFIPFPGGSIIGEQFGKIIAAQFGVPATPDAVTGAIAGNPNEVVIAKINAAVAQARAEIEGFTTYEKAVLETIQVSLKETGATMRAELDPEKRHWFFTGWRPAIGWVFVAFSISFGLMLTVAAAAAAFADNPRPLQILSDAWPIFLAYFGTLGLMVGVYIPSRSIEKKAGVDTSAKTPAPPVPAPKPPTKPPAPITREPRT